MASTGSLEVSAPRGSLEGGAGASARAKLAAAALLALMAVPVVVYASPTTATTASYLLDIYESTRARLIEIVEVYVNWTAGASNATSASGPCHQLEVNVEAAIAEGDALAEQARAALEAGNADEAAVLAIRAINALTRAFVQATVCVSFPGEARNQTAPPGLMAAITRLEVRLSRLMATAEAAEASGMNVSGVIDLLQEASAELQVAREAALSGDVRAAAESISRANRLMGEAISIIKTASTVAVEHRAREFCRHGNCTAQVLNLTRMTERMREKIAERCRALGLVEANITAPGMRHKEEHKKMHGPPENVTAPPTEPPVSGEHPGRGREHPGEAPAPPAEGEQPPVDHEEAHCPPRGCGG
ncbi:MAG: hypothetical protein QI223_07045 [Candidatus Korarchaeota archaeon]|nr:hypothetical protein [Candidatus Korarchaeota archaeon]